MADHRGKFYIDIDIVKKDPYEIFALLKFVPYRVECLLYNGTVEYMGTSPLFNEVEIGDITPEYDIILNGEDEDGRVLQVAAQLILT